MTTKRDPHPPKDAQPDVQQASDTDQDPARLVASLSDDKRIERIEKSLTEFSAFSGPLPRPEDFEKYNEILPNAADRILAMAEKEQLIRADGQAGILANDRLKINRATLLGVGLIVVAGVATWLGHTAIALPLGLVGTVAALLRQIMDWLDQRQSRRPPSLPEKPDDRLPFKVVSPSQATDRPVLPAPPVGRGPRRTPGCGQARVPGPGRTGRGGGASGACRLPVAASPPGRT